jgi:hypothetical protein
MVPNMRCITSTQIRLSELTLILPGGPDPMENVAASALIDYARSQQFRADLHNERATRSCDGAWPVVR